MEEEMKEFELKVDGSYMKIQGGVEIFFQTAKSFMDQKRIVEVKRKGVWTKI